MHVDALRAMRVYDFGRAGAHHTVQLSGCTGDALVVELPTIDDV